MARISSYPFDIDIQDTDAWIGSDSISRQTKQYTAEAVAKYLNIKGKISIGGQMNYELIDAPRSKGGSIAFPNGGGDGTLFSAITSLNISTKDLSNQTTVAYLNFLVGNEILIMDQSDKQNFGHYKITSYVIDALNNSFYNIQLTFLGGNGAVDIDRYYNIFNFTFAGDKTFDFEQTIPSATWNIQHNLGKFPSITVVDTVNTVVIGEYTYIDNNNVRLNFSAAFGGKAYLN